MEGAFEREIATVNVDIHYKRATLDIRAKACKLRTFKKHMIKISRRTSEIHLYPFLILFGYLVSVF